MQTDQCGCTAMEFWDRLAFLKSVSFIFLITRAMSVGTFGWSSELDHVPHTCSTDLDSGCFCMGFDYCTIGREQC